MATERYDRFYGEEKSILLFRQDLFKDTKEPNLEWLRNETVATSLQYLDTWSHVSTSELPEYDTARAPLEQARGHAKSYVDVIRGITKIEDASRQKHNLEEQAGHLLQQCNRLRKNEMSKVVYKLRNDLSEASKLLELVCALNKRIDDFHKEVSGTAETFKKTAFDAAIKFDETLKEAALYKERTKETFEKGADFFHNLGLTAFGKAFEQEAEGAEEKAGTAGQNAATYTKVLVAFIFGLIAMDVWGFTSSTADALVYWKWFSIRVVGAAVLVWFIAHFLKEQRNFLHVAVANRHRQNLCNSYVAISEKMSPEERKRYLDEILPHISPLGKTGFITKEDIPEMPGTQIVKSIVETAGRK